MRDQRAWLDVLDVDGPFLAAAALDTETVGAGWPARLTAEQRRVLAGDQSETEALADRYDRVAVLLEELLGYRPGETMTEVRGERVQHPRGGAAIPVDFLLHKKDDPTHVAMVVLCDPELVPENEALAPGRVVKQWDGSLIEAAAAVCRARGTDFALLTTGDEFCLVNVVTGTTGAATWTRDSLEERPAQDALVALLHRSRLLDRTMPLAELHRRSRTRQSELTDTLGRQVRRAAEVLVESISRANRRTRGRLLAGIDGDEIYRAVTTVLMRTVFLLVAEERGMLPLGRDGLYSDQYAVGTLLDRLEADAYRNRSAMERRSGAWVRLLAQSRAIHGGAPGIGVAGLGGALFDPQRFPFLEGAVEHQARPVERLDIGVVDDFTVLTILRLLQLDRGQRISFRALGVDQIGHVYESLLDHTARVVDVDEVAVLGLQGRVGLEPEVALVQLEAWAAEGRKELGGALTDAGVASDAKAVYALIDAGRGADDPVAATLHVAAGGDVELLERLRPFSGLVRPDARDIATVYLPGDVYVTSATERSDTGTYYTPTGLIEQILDAALEPTIDEVLHEAGDEADDRATALLGITVLDPACGSGHFLVGAARRIAARLVAERADSPDREDHRIAMRDVITSCIYGADMNPQAIELAKLSLWLESYVPGRPLTFLDHRFAVGDSLIGARLADLGADIPAAAFTAVTGDHRKTAKAWGRVARERGSGQGSLLAGGGLPDLEAVARRAARYATAPDHTLEAVEDKARQVEEVRRSGELQRANALADLWCAAFVAAKEDGVPPDIVDAYYDLRDGATPRLAPESDRPFVHWDLAFPELVADADGRLFDVVVGNPPYLRGREHGQQDPHGRAFSTYRWEPCSGSTWNLYVPFILMASTLARRRSALLVQSSVLGAQFAGDVHRWVVDHRGVEAVLDFSGVPNLFHGAAVQVASLVLLPEPAAATRFVRYGPGLEVELEVAIDGEELRLLPDGYWTLPTSGLPRELIEVFLEPVHRLGDLASIADGMEQTAAYDVRPLVHEQTGAADEVRLTPTGLIDPFVSMWGDKQVRYLKARYDLPVLSTTELRQHGFDAMADQAEATKIGIAGLSKRIEAVVDEGRSLISKSAFVIRLEDPDICPFAVAALLNSPVMNELYDAAYGALGFGAGSKNYRPPTLGGLPLPEMQFLTSSDSPNTLSGFGKAAHQLGQYDEEVLDGLARRALASVRSS